MSDDTDRVVATLQDMMAAVQSIAEFKITQLVFDRDDAESKLTGLKSFPAAVVQYEGMRGIPGGGSQRQSISAVLVASVMVINSGEQIIRQADTKIPTILLLTELRGKFLNRRAPSGHLWEFLVEAAAEASGNLSFWVQRWQVPIQWQPRR